MEVAGVNSDQITADDDGAELVLFLGVPIEAAIGHTVAPARGLEVSSPPADSAEAAKLREGMRKLWTDHVIWTRGYIVAAIDGCRTHSPTASSNNSRTGSSRRPRRSSSISVKGDDHRGQAIDHRETN